MDRGEPRTPHAFAYQDLDCAGSVLIDDRAPGGMRGTTYWLCNPRETIIAHAPQDVPEALSRMAAALVAGRYVAGYLAYDAGLGFDKPLRSRHAPQVPLVWLGVYDACTVLDAAAIDLGPGGSTGAIRDLRLHVDRQAYRAAVAQILRYIAAGDVYQINYTCKLQFENVGSPRKLFARLRKAHPVGHAAWINTGPVQVLSLSPELFLRVENGVVTTRPMKGTLQRGRWSEEDDQLAAALAADAKNRAENVMIVDLMRNDLGRLCELGSVQVAQPLAVERYRSLLQMTSAVTGRLRPGTTAIDLLRATFPPGSVTGAPKLRALEIIDEVECESRGVYCGAIGLFQPTGDCLLNVAIRTIVQQGTHCELGVGSGIVADSDAEAEWNEMQLKGCFLQAEPVAFELLETLRVDREGRIAYREAHVARMAASARYFGWDYPADLVRETLDRHAVPAAEERRLRLLLSIRGDVRCEALPLPEAAAAGPVRVLLAERTIDSADVFLYHKTTRRTAYDTEWRAAQARGCFDLLYCNSSGAITEGAITNLVAQLDSRWLTPPLTCGLLPGVWRAERLRSGDVQEDVLQLPDLLRATRIVLGNSVRGAIEVDELVDGAGNTRWRRGS